jgi:hypothetical protein
LVGRCVQTPGSLCKQNLANLSGRTAQGSAAVLNGVAAGGVTLIHSPARVRGDEAHLFKRNFELFGHHLQQCGLDALSQLRLACECGDAAVGIDPDPGIQQRSPCQAAGKRRF